MNERTLTSLVDTLLAAVDGKADIDHRILLAQALQVIDRRLTALEGAVSWCGACGNGKMGHTQGHEYQPVLTEEEGRVVWNKLYGSEGERDPVTGAVKVASPDLLRLADEAIDACEDAKERLTFSSWEAAGQKVRAYREARRKGAISHVCGPDGPCTYHRTGGVPAYRCSGVAIDITLAPGRPVQL